MKQLSVPKLTSASALPTEGACAEIDCVNWVDYPYCPKVSFRIGYTDTSLCILFSVEEQNVKAVCTESNGAVWEDSCVEFFVRVPDSPYYFNFETNCIGTGLAAKRLSRADFTHFTEEKMARVVRRSSLPHKPVDAVDGSWTLYLEVPFDLLSLECAPERLRANFYKCGDRTATPHFVSWNPIDAPKPDFHLPEFFGELILK